MNIVFVYAVKKKTKKSKILEIGMAYYILIKMVFNTHFSI